MILPCNNKTYINTDFCRNSKYVDIVREEFDGFDIKSAWEKFDIDFTYCSPTDTAFSKIDHFILSQELLESVKDAGVIHLGDNVSGHSPIYLKLNTGSLPCYQEQERIYSPKQNWKKATDDDKMMFKTAVTESVTNVEIPASVIDCYDVHCTDPMHIVNIDNYTLDVIKCLEVAAESSIPYTRPNPEKESQSQAGKNR